MHETERVSDRDGVEDPFASQRVDAAISKSGGHDAPGLTIHLNGAKLKVEIHSLHEIRALRKTFVFAHVVAQSEVTIRGNSF